MTAFQSKGIKLQRTEFKFQNQGSLLFFTKCRAYVHPKTKQINIQHKTIGNAQITSLKINKQKLLIYLLRHHIAQVCQK